MSDCTSLCAIGREPTRPARFDEHGRYGLTVTKLSLVEKENIRYNWIITEELFLIMSSTELSILTKTIDLARRHGLKLSDYTAHYRCDRDHEYITFTAAPTEAPALERFDRMMNSLGSLGNSQEVVADSIDDLESRLDNAIRRAPRSREV